MKYILSSLLSFFIFFLLISTASALPMTVSLEGQISSIPIYYNDSAGILAEQGISIGSMIKYSFLIDFDLNAFTVMNDNSTVSYVDGIGSSTSSNIDYFYAELLSGAIIPEKNGGFYNDADQAADIHYGVRNGGADAEWVIVTGSSNSLVRLDWPSEDSWLDGIINVGEVARIQCWGYDSFGNKSYFRTDLTVTETSSITPVPEPATILLLSFGFFFISEAKARMNMK
jgi:hypothetical protein